MIILDFLFLVCYTPFSVLPKTERRTERDLRFVALIWLIPPMSFVTMGILNVLIYFFGLKANGIFVATILAGISIALFLILYKVYVVGNRHIGIPRFPLLSSLLLLVMLIGSLVFMVYSLAKFR